MAIEEPIAPGGVADPERYRAAVEVLADIQAEPRPAELPVPGSDRIHRLPPFTAEALAVEVAFFLDWYLPHGDGEPLPLKL